MIYLAFLSIVALVVVTIVLAANGKLFKLVDEMRGMLDGNAAMRGSQPRGTTQRGDNNGVNVHDLVKRMDKMEETNRELASYVDTLKRTFNAQNRQICSLEKEISRLSALSVGYPTGKTTNTPVSPTSTTASKPQQVEKRTDERNGLLILGTKYFVSSPSGVNPIRFALADLSEQPQGYFYCLVVKSATRAVLQLNPDREAMKGFISSLYYQTDCVDVLSRPDGIPTNIETKSVGELELNGDCWVLKQKIQIKIN